jgi:hypothetical protein
MLTILHFANAPKIEIRFKPAQLSQLPRQLYQTLQPVHVGLHTVYDRQQYGHADDTAQTGKDSDGKARDNTANQHQQVPRLQYYRQ